MQELLTEKTVAAKLGIAPLTLRNWRIEGRGPVYVRLAHNAIRYRACDVDAWLAEKVTGPTPAKLVGSGYAANPKRVLELAYALHIQSTGGQVDRKDAHSIAVAVDELCDWSL